MKEENKEETIDKLLESDNVNENLLLLTKVIYNKFKNWFPLSKLYKINEINFFKQDEMLAFMGLICTKGYAHHKVEKGIDYFKITLDKDSKIKLIKDDIKNHQEKIDTLKREIERLKN